MFMFFTLSVPRCAFINSDHHARCISLYSVAPQAFMQWNMAIGH